MSQSGLPDTLGLEGNNRHWGPGI